MWYLYIIKCSDGSLYTGITTDVKKRVEKHNLGKGSKAVRGKLPAVLVYKEELSSKIEAAKREREIKSWDRKKKLDMVALAQW